MNKAKVSVFDRGFLYGDGLFETMRSYDGAVFKLLRHLSRLFSSSGIIKIKIPYSKKDLEKAVCRTLEKERLKDASVRITVTRGEGAFTLLRRKFSASEGSALMKSGQSKPGVIITAKKFNGYPEEFYSRGISAGISGIRQDEFSPLSGIKSLNYLNHILARMRAQDEGFDEAILLNTKGRVAEAATSNIFLMKRGALLTPSLDNGILPGITRSEIIRIARSLGMKVGERVVLPRELSDADEVFLTNSLAEVLPVVRVGCARIGSGKPGAATKLLHAAYRAEVSK